MVSTTGVFTAGMLREAAGVASSEPDEPLVMTARSAPSPRMWVALFLQRLLRVEPFGVLVAEFDDGAEVYQFLESVPCSAWVPSRA